MNSHSEKTKSPTIHCGRLTETERKKILELHKKGVPATKIAQELDRSPSTVRRVIKGA